MSILDDIDNALSGGSKAAFNAESPIGTTVSGTITDVDYRQVTDFTTQQPATFPSGDPKMQFIIRIQTTQSVDDDDDGIRGIYIPAWGKRKAALTKAIRACGAKRGSDVLIPGTGFSATYNGEKRADGGPSGSYSYKSYSYEFTKGASESATAAADAITADEPPAGFTAEQWAKMPDATKTAIRAAQQ